MTIENLVNIVITESKKYAIENNDQIKTIVEFIYKKSANKFYTQLKSRVNQEFEIFLLSGTILEPRRRQIIDCIKNNNSDKTILVTTQVVEAGFDIDMDIGFKDKSLIDSDEQLAGRINRNASKAMAKLFLFDLDTAYRIYGNDLRYKITRDEIDINEYQYILENKEFDYLYKKVCNKINEQNKDEFLKNFNDYKFHIKQLDFFRVNHDFKIIDQESVAFFVPLPIDKSLFHENELIFLSDLDPNAMDNKYVYGDNVWQKYLKIIKNNELDFMHKNISLKKIYSILSNFMFSLIVHSSVYNELCKYSDFTQSTENILYLSAWEEIYDFESGINANKFNENMIFD